MTLRTKLSLTVFATILVASASLTAALIVLERSKLREDSQGRAELIADAAAKTAKESLMDPDDLMMVSHLKLLLAEHPFFLTARMRSKAGTVEVGAHDIPAEEKPFVVKRVVTLPVGWQPPKGAVVHPRLELELVFSGRRLEDDVQATLDRSVTWAERLTVLLAAAAILASLLIARAFIRPINALSEAMDHIGRGDLGVQVQAVGKDELGKVAGKLNEMSTKLMELDRMKKQFVASVTHELKSPLGAIESYVRMLLERQDLNERQQVHLKRIEESAARLGQFIENVLEKSKIERGKLEHSPLKADLGELVKETTLFFRPRFNEAGLNLVTFREPGLPQAWMDPERIQQVVVNLVSNALKFTPKGGTVKVSVLRSKEGGLLCQVEDSGVGIAPADVKRVFQPFERVPNALRASGAGLGLSICQSIVERHGGTIGVESEPGRGSRFWFTVPSAASVAR